MTSILTRGNEVRVNTYTNSEQFSNSVTTLSDGRYVVTWQSYAQDGGSYGVYMQMYDASGAKIGSETRVNTTTANSQSEPDIVALEGGGFVVAWQSLGQDGGGYGTYFQRYDENGWAIGGETLINTTTANDQYGVSLSALQGGGFVATWTSLNQDVANSYGVYAKVFSEGGAAISSELAVNTTTAGTQTASQVATLSDGSFVVTWISDGQDGSNYGVYMRRFNALGTALTSETLVNTTTINAQNNGDIIALANGGYVVSWYGNGEQTNNVEDTGVFYQIYDANNNQVGGETLVNSYTSNSQLYPSMTALSDGGFVVTWSSYGQDGSGYGVYGQRYDENGSKIGPEFQVNSNTYSTQYQPSVSALEDGGFVVTWTSDVQDGSFYGVYSRRYGNATTFSGTQYLYGTINNDLLDGGIGNDYMYGGVGNDTYVVNSLGDVLGENADEGFDSVESSITYSLEGTELDDLTLTGLSDLNATGNDYSNVITGNNGINVINAMGGNDTVFAGAGVDNIEGGDGSDTIWGEAGNDQIFGDAGFDLLYGGDGDDQIIAGEGGARITGDAGNDTLSGGTESSLVQGGAGLDVITGGLGADTLLGGEDNDYFFASAGADFISGDSGVDTFDASPLAASVNINLGTGRARYLSDYSTISGIENLIGSSFGDKLVGDAANNVIDGGAGADTMIGGLGNDIYYYDNDGDTITEIDGQGDDLLFSSVNVALGSRSVETVVLTGSADLTFSSSSQATEVWGNSGNNNINAGLGADTIYGGLGNDTIYVDDAGDVVVENAGEGTDRVSSSVTYTLAANVENLTLTGTANINGTGNSLANSMVGNSGNNVLDGGSGNASDSLRGGLGNDTYVFNLGFGIDDITNETGGADTILFGAGITSGMIITQDVGADRYYAIDDGVHQASACANRIKIVGGAAGTIETIAYTPPAAPALSPAASSAQLAQAIAALPVSGASASETLVQNATSTTPNLGVTSLIQGQRFAA